MEQNPDQIRGFGLALLCGMILGSAVAVSRYAYDGGASGIVVAIGRSVVMIAILVVGIKLAGWSLRLPVGTLQLVLVNGVLMGVMSYGNIGAVEYISVGLASLLFFTFPVVIALLVIVFRLERLNFAKLATILLAFIGLGVMLSDSIGQVDGRGTALSLIGSFATAVNAILVGRYFRHLNVFVVTLHFSIVAFVFLVFLSLTVAEVTFPHTPAGWGGMLGVAIFQAIGTPLYFLAIRKIGALKTAMATNIQPLTSIFEAWLLFDEVLSLIQAAGGALVLAAIGLMQWVDFKWTRRVVSVAPKSQSE